MYLNLHIFGVSPYERQHHYGIYEVLHLMGDDIPVTSPAMPIIKIENGQLKIEGIENETVAYFYRIGKCQISQEAQSGSG